MSNGLKRKNTLTPTFTRIQNQVTTTTGLLHHQFVPIDDVTRHVNQVVGYARAIKHSEAS